MKTPTLMKRDFVAINLIDVQDRLRPVSEAGINSLIASITELGVMKDAIHLRQLKGGRLVLIAGGHRLEAARQLGWTEIAAQIWTDVTDDWARLMEVDDNLAGAEMNALDTAVFLSERKRVYEKLHPETAAFAFKGNRHTGSLVADMMSVTSFAAATAEKFGLTDRHVRRMPGCSVRRISGGSWRVAHPRPAVHFGPRRHSKAPATAPASSSARSAGWSSNPTSIRWAVRSASGTQPKPGR